MLGDLVNVVARYLRDHARNYVQEIRGPALKLLALYGLQVSAKEMFLYHEIFYHLLCLSFDKKFSAAK